MRVRTAGIVLAAVAGAAAVAVFQPAERGSAAVMDRARFLQGGPDTLAGGEEFVGELVSADFQILGDALVVPVRGYPAADGNSLTLEILADKGSRFAAVRYAGANPGNAVLQWRIPVGQWWKMHARFVLTDGRKSDEAWLAIGLPIAEHVDPDP